MAIDGTSGSQEVAIPGNTHRATQQIFERRARQASHQALFYLYTLEPSLDPKTDCALKKYAPFAFNQVEALVESINVPSVGTGSTVDAEEMNHAQRTKECWEKIATGLKVPPVLDYPYGKAGKLRQDFQEFLKVTSPHDSLGKFAHKATTTLKYINKNLVAIFVLLSAGLLLCTIEAIYSLLRNEILTTGIFVGLFLVVVVLTFSDRLRRWGTGRRGFLSWRHMALPPDRGIDRWPNANVRNRMFRDALCRLVLLVILLIIIGAILWCIPGSSETTFTVFLIVSVVTVALYLSHLVDFWDYVDPWPIRSLALVVILSFASVSLFVTIGKVVALAFLSGTAILANVFVPAEGPRRKVAYSFLLTVVIGVLSFSEAVPKPHDVLWAAVAVFALLGLLLAGTHILSLTTGKGYRVAVMVACILYAMDIVFAVWSCWEPLVRPGPETAWAMFLLLGVGTLSLRPVLGKARLVGVVFVVYAHLLLVGSWDTNSMVWRDPPQATNTLRYVGKGEWPRSRGNPRSPVVVMAASGGGSRAAYFTALTLKRLYKCFPEVADNLQCISSVSGGSLANAAYVATLMEAGTDREKCIGRLDSLATLVSRDFLLPTLVGALVPWTNRGRCIESSWENQVGLGEISLDSIAGQWLKANEGLIPPFPLPIFNSCTLDGHAVVISPMDCSLYRPMTEHYGPMMNDRKDDETWVYDRDGIYALQDFLTHRDPKLYEAVRASANFPFGFPLVEVQTTRWLYLSPLKRDVENGPKTIRLTDGGVLSNSGMWSLFHLLMERSSDLKGRRLLLIIVEASKMPEYQADQRTTSSLYSTIADKNAVGQNLHRQMLKRLQKEFGDSLTVVQLDLIPDECHNVLTTWALTDKYLRSLDASFRASWQEAEKVLQEWAPKEPEKAECSSAEPKAVEPKRGKIPLKRPPSS